MITGFSLEGVMREPLPNIPGGGAPICLSTADQFPLVVVRLCWPDLSDDEVRDIAKQLVEDVASELDLTTRANEATNSKDSLLSRSFEK
jgi:hypothetical protein